MQYKHFSVEERERIQRGHWEKRSIRAIAGEFGRSPASVSRELRRNYPKEHKVYTPRLAQERALFKRTQRGARRYQRVLKPQGPSIDIRPAVVQMRSRIGDWESDTVESRDHAPGINTLVERKTGLVLITKLRSKKGASTRTAITRRFSKLPVHLRKTITFDNGPENRDWRPIETTTGAKCYFAHPYHSWEHGTNENTNGLIRDHFPKGTDFRTISEEELAFVERELNERPRKRLGWKSPLQAFGVALQS